MRKLIAISLVTILIIGLAGCGSKSAGTEDGSKTVGTESNVKTVRVGIGNILAPQFYIDQDGELIGYDVEALKAADELLPQYEFKFEQMEFASLLVSLEAGKIDIADFQLSKTAEREETYLFPDENYDVANTVLVVSADKPEINGFEDMAGMSIAQMPTSNFYTMVDTYNKEYPDAAVNLQAIDSLPVADALQMVSDGRIDGTICLKSTFTQLQKTMKLDLRIAGVLQSYPVYWILQKDAEQLKTDIDGALDELKKNGKLSEIAVKWYGEDVFAK